MVLPRLDSSGADSSPASRARRQQAVIFALRASLARVGIFRMPGIVEHVGPLVRDYRAGLGMPRRAKVVACTAIATASPRREKAKPQLRTACIKRGRKVRQPVINMRTPRRAPAVWQRARPGAQAQPQA